MKKDGVSITSGKSRFLYLKAFLIGIAALFCSLLLFAAGMTLFGGGAAYAPLFSTLSSAAAAFAASFYLAKHNRKNGWLSGLIVGGTVFLVLTATALVMNGGGLTLTTAFRFIILLLCALIGGILGIGKADAHRYL